MLKYLKRLIRLQNLDTNIQEKSQYYNEIYIFSIFTYSFNCYRVDTNWINLTSSTKLIVDLPLRVILLVTETKLSFNHHAENQKLMKTFHNQTFFKTRKFDKFTGSSVSEMYNTEQHFSLKLQSQWMKKFIQYTNQRHLNFKLNVQNKRKKYHYSL